MIKTIGFLGCGNMGGAIARAVCKAADPQNVYLANRTASKAEKLAGELGCNTTTNALSTGSSSKALASSKLVKPNAKPAQANTITSRWAKNTASPTSATQSSCSSRCNTADISARMTLCD